MKLENISLSFIYKDGNEEIEIKASICNDGWQQWGAPKDILGENVHLLEALTQTVGENAELEN